MRRVDPTDETELAAGQAICLSTDFPHSAFSPLRGFAIESPGASPQQRLRSPRYGI